MKINFYPVIRYVFDVKYKNKINSALYAIHYKVTKILSNSKKNN